MARMSRTSTSARYFKVRRGLVFVPHDRVTSRLRAAWDTKPLNLMFAFHL